MSNAIQRVLLYRLGSLGDTMVALPALHLVQRAFPEAERRLLTNFPVNVKAPPAAAVLENTGLVHGYFRYAVGTRSPPELLTLWSQLVRWRPQVLVYLGPPRGTESARRDALFFRLCGISSQIGVPLTEDMQRNLLLNPGSSPGLNSINSPGPGLVPEFEPEASRLARNISDLGPADLDDPASWDLHLTPAEHGRASEALSPAAHLPIIAASVGTKVQAKDWGRDNWQALFARLALLYPGHALVLTGAPEESEASDFAARIWKSSSGNPVLNLCGTLTPRESAAVYTRARVFIGHDSGPMHLAAAVQTPCVAIFAARNLPRIWFPYGPRHRVLYHQVECAGCKLETCILQKKRCLTSITVDEVLSRINDVLSGGAPLGAEPLAPEIRRAGMR